MAIVYHRVDLKNQAGTRIASMTHWRKLHYASEVNEIGFAVLELSGEDIHTDLFGVDFQLEIYRSVPEYGIAWYKNWEGFCRSFVYTTDENGLERFTVTAVGYNDLLRRGMILAQPGEAAAQKTGPAETVIKEYVDENIGPGAGAYAMPGLTIQADAATGATVWKNAGYENLMDVCHAVAKEGLGDFQIIGNGAATFVFRWYDGQMGEDRTVGNAGGLPAVIFAKNRGNMLVPEYATSRMEEVNHVYVGGDGEYPARPIQIVEDAVQIAKSPWNRIVIFRQAPNTDVADDLIATGTETLEEKKYTQELQFGVQQAPSCVYGRDYDLGTKVTGLYRNETVDDRITKIDITVTPQTSESIRVELSNAR